MGAVNPDEERRQPRVLVDSPSLYEELIDDPENDFIPIDDEFGSQPGPPIREKCSSCEIMIRRAQQFACARCVIWPVCGHCMYSHHYSKEHKNCFRVSHKFMKHTKAFSTWWNFFGQDQHRILLRFEKRITFSMRIFEDLVSIASCCEDPIFRNVVWKNFYEPVAEYERLLIPTMSKFVHMQHINDLLLRFLRSNSAMPPNAPMQKLVFFEWGIDRPEDMVAQFCSVTVKSVTLAMDKALKKLESMNRVLKASVSKEDTDRR